MAIFNSYVKLPEGIYGDDWGMVMTTVADRLSKITTDRYCKTMDFTPQDKAYEKAPKPLRLPQEDEIICQISLLIMSIIYIYRT